MFVHLIRGGGGVLLYIHPNQLLVMVLMCTANMGYVNGSFN